MKVEQAKEENLMKIEKLYTNNKEKLENKMSITNMINEGGSFGVMANYFNDEANIEKAEHRLKNKEQFLH